MPAPKSITRNRLTKYVALLGRGSVADQALTRLDTEKAQGRRASASMRNNGFAVTVWSAGGIPETYRFG